MAACGMKIERMISHDIGKEDRLSLLTIVTLVEGGRRREMWYVGSLTEHVGFPAQQHTLSPVIDLGSGKSFDCFGQIHNDSRAEKPQNTSKLCRGRGGRSRVVAWTRLDIAMLERTTSRWMNDQEEASGREQKVKFQALLQHGQYP